MDFRLLPQPRQLNRKQGTLRLAPVLRLADGAPPGPGPDPAWHIVRGILENELGVRVLRDRPARGPERSAGLDLRAGRDAEDESYELTVSRDRVALQAPGPRGRRHGLHTLAQLLRQFGARLPCLEIRDAPAFPHRGFYLDISRGKVPRLDTLRRLVDRLAAIKINQLQLYVEHTFAFRFDRRIGAGSDPLTARDIRSLDTYARERGVELVPSLASFGHMGRVLSLAPYRRLAEIEWPARDWESASWTQRLRGATIDPTQRASRELLERMLSEFLPLFSSGFFNMCGDETYDLGRGRSARKAARRGVAALYLAHLRFLRRVAAAHGKRLMFWGDVMLQHPDALPRLPRDVIGLDWGYERDTPFAKVGRFTRAGLDAYVCPSTRGYRVVFNEVEVARANITGYARAGLRLGARGVLTTDWGDMGHFNMAACSLHGTALGAAMAWNPKADEGRDFDRAFSLQVFGDRTGRVAELYRRAGTTGLARWPMLLEPAPPAPAAERRRARNLRESVRSLAAAFARLEPRYGVGPEDLAQLALAATALQLNIEKLLLTDRSRARFRRALRDFAAAHQEVWLMTNRRSGLDELTRAFLRAAGGIPAGPGGRP